ncbi:MAG TPA: hypothetical protein PL070_10750 [Flavobacteriales bacterium]|nr:hypothetical protein [Flavobacteriales bacterium]
MQEFLSAITVVATAMVKFLFAGLVSYGLGHGFVKTLVYTAIGGSAGMLTFYFSGKGLLEFFRKRYLRRVQERVAKGLPPKPIFTRTNRLIVKVKRRYGIIGLASFAPPTLSIPITAVLAAKYFRHDRRTLPSLLVSVLIWSVVLSTAWSFIR